MFSHLHDSILNVICQFSAQVESLFKSSCSVRGSCSYSTEHKKEVHYTLVHNTTITAVRKIHSGAQHIPFVFADDTKYLLAIRSTDDIDKLQSDVNSTDMWSQSTDLLFNEAKFVHVCFWAKSFSDLNSTTYTVNGKPIRQLLQHKDLGVIFSSNLDWTDHYKTITMKAYKMLGLIRRTFKTNCIEAKKQLYISLIRSQLIYCSQI